MCKYIFSEKISFDKEYIILREPLTSEIDGMNDDYKNNISILKKIFKNCIIDSSFINDDGSKASNEDIYNALIKSGSLFSELLNEWISKTPFTISNIETREIRQVAKMLFSGSDPLSQPETRTLFWKYKTILEMFLICIDKRTGNLIHLPFDTDLYYQPAKTMSFFRLLQNIYCENLKLSLKDMI